MINDPHAWETISSRVILDHKLLRVTEDKVKLPSGAEIKYVRQGPSSADSVIVIALNVNREVLIQREYSYPPNKVMWQLPGGSIKPKESIESAAKRELAEESGFSTKVTKMLGSFYVHNRLSDQKQHVVLCQELFKHKLAEDEDEFIESHWMNKNKLKSMIAKAKFDNINLLAALNLWFCSEEERSTRE